MTDNTRISVMNYIFIKFWQIREKISTDLAGIDRKADKLDLKSWNAENIRKILRFEIISWKALFCAKWQDDIQYNWAVYGKKILCSIVKTY